MFYTQALYETQPYDADMLPGHNNAQLTLMWTYCSAFNSDREVWIIIIV